MCFRVKPTQSEQLSLSKGRKNKFIFQGKVKLEEHQTLSELTVHTATEEGEQIPVVLNRVFIQLQNCLVVFIVVVFCPLITALAAGKH